MEIRVAVRATGILVCVLLQAWHGPGAQSWAIGPDDAAQTFEMRIAPLLARHCLECHDSGTTKGGLDLSRKATALAGGEGGAVLVPGRAADSLLWQHVESGEMPKGRPALPAEEKQLLREWIDAGAVWTLDVIDASVSGGDRRAAGTWLQRLSVPEYVETVRSAVGVDVERDVRRLLPPDVRADGFSNTAYNLQIDLAHVEAYARLAQLIVRRMDLPEFVHTHAPSEIVTRALDTSGSPAPVEAARREVISTVGKWLLRGPLDEHEVTLFLGLASAVATDGGDFTEAMSYVIEAMLQSPRFLYRVEDQRGDGSPRPVSGYELASRMSYILWGGPPDKELFRAAEAGELSDRGRTEAQVERMLQDPRAIERSCRFLHDWLDLDRLANLRPNGERFPDWDAHLGADMRDEALAFFRHVAWEERRPLSDLMNARVTFVTPRLAAHYGLDRRLGSDPDASSVRVASRTAAGLQALYTFKERRGDEVHDVSGTGEPLHLKVADPSAVRWSDAGLTVRSSTLIAAADSPRRLIDAVRASGAITLEAWVTPASAAQTGPSRIVTLSTSVLARNFTLGQDNDRFDIRLRSTATNESGQPSVGSAPGAAGTVPVHVVYTRDASGAAVVYVNGRESGRGQVGGDLSNWDGAFQLALANEISRDRTWLGTYHLVAVYDRALPAEEVRQNHAAGSGRDLSRLARRVDAAPHSAALYSFEEGEGDVVRDSSNAGGPLDLRIEDPSAVEWKRDGLAVTGRGLVATVLPPKRLIDAIKKSNALTLEALVTPGDVSQSGPARIFTLSSGTGTRNFTLGQDADKFDVRFRSTKTDENGTPSLATAASAVQTRRTHVVYTRAADGKARLYVDGEEQGSRDVGGDLSNWGDDFRLALGNETTHDRPWRGTFHRLTVYSRALTPDEIRGLDRGPSRYDLTSVPGRGGLLTQGSLLTIGGDDASMVTRGLFVLQDLLGGRVGSPPPCVDTTPVPTKPGLSHRAIAEARIANQACGGCHAKFEPLAFGLEKFDGLGGYGDVDEYGNALRDDGEVLFPGAERPVAYRNSAELMDLLAGSERVRWNLTRKVAQFALGRPLVEADVPILDRIHAAAQAGGGTYPSLITAIVMSDLVRMTGTEKER